MNLQALNIDPDYVTHGPFTVVEQRVWGGPTIMAGPYEEFAQVWMVMLAVHFKDDVYPNDLFTLCIIDGNGRIISGHVMDERFVPPVTVMAVVPHSVTGLLPGTGKLGDRFNIEELIESSAEGRRLYDELCRVRGLS